MQAADPVTAKSIRVTSDALVIVLADHEVAVPWDQCSRSLARATQQERFNAELSPGGYGIHWPALDEDLSIHGLVALAARQSRSA